jgi:histone-lysine N-methyltransferase SETD2
MTKTKNALGYDRSYIKKILDDYEVYKKDLDGNPNDRIFCQERNLNISTFRNWFKDHSKANSSIFRGKLREWVRKQHALGLKVTWKDLVLKMKSENILFCQEKKYHALRMFAKRILKSVSGDMGYRHITKNVYKIPVNDGINTHREVPNSEVTVELFATESKGFGVRAMDKIEKGVFIIEYVGEVISKKESIERLQKGRGRYLMGAGSGMIIDARDRGNYARFINHDCVANAHCVLCVVKGLPRLLVIAQRRISKGEEVTIDYGNEYRFEEYCKCASCSSV